MKREIITTDSYGRITIPSDTGNIWMNEMELVELFGVIAPTLRAAIRAVYKCGVLNPLEAEKRIRLRLLCGHVCPADGGGTRFPY